MPDVPPPKADDPRAAPSKRSRSGGDELVGVLRGAGWALSIRIAAAGAGYLSQVLLARWLGTSAFGIYGFALSCLLLLAMLSGLGLPAAGVRFVSAYASRGDWARVRGFVQRSARLVLGAGTAVGAIGVVVATAGAGGTIGSQYESALVAASLAVPIVALVGLRSEVARGFGWVDVAYGPSQLGAPLLLIGFAGLAVRGAGALSARDAVLLTLASYLAVLAIQEVGFRRRRPGSGRGVAPRFETRVWIRVALPLLLTTAAVTSIFHMDVLLVGLLRTPSEVAVYGAAARTAFLVTLVVQAVNTLAAPRFAFHHAQASRTELGDLVGRLSHWIFWPSLAVVLVLVVAGRPVLGLFGPDFGAGYTALVILAAGHLVSAAAGPAAQLLNMTGHQGECARAFMGAAAAALLGHVALIPRLGIEGAALVTATTLALANLWLLRRVRRHLRVDPSIRSLTVR